MQKGTQIFNDVLLLMKKILKSFPRAVNVSVMASV